MVFICDGMFLFEKVKAPLSTFGDVYNFLKQVVKSDCRVFFFATDLYQSNSIKYLKRKSRSMIGLLQMKRLETRLEIRNR